jgi:hypothetical protein
MENKKTKLKERMVFLVKAVSTKNLGICDNHNNWYNIEKDLDDIIKKDIELTLADIQNGDKVSLKLNENGNFFEVSKIETKPEEQETVTKVDTIIKDRGEVWKKCFDTIKSHAGNVENLETIMPSVNSLFIETCRSMR